jgi:ArsR family transcriptional regulator
MIDSTRAEVDLASAVEAERDTDASAADASVSLLQAVADPVRWTVLQLLASAASCVCNLQEHIPVPANLLSYHLKVLREAGLVTTSRRGRWIDYALADGALERLHTALPAAPPRPAEGQRCAAQGQRTAEGRR